MSDSQETSSHKSSKLSLNIILHVTILFTILSLLFMLIISKLTTTVITHEISGIIKDSFEKNLYTADKKPIVPSISINGLSNSASNQIITTMMDLLQNEINVIIKNDSTIQKLYNTNAELINQMTVATSVAIKQKLQQNIDSTTSQININIGNIIDKFPYDYYINIFKQQDIFRQTINNNLFTQIMLVNILLVIFLIFFISISLLNNTLTMGEIGHIFLENMITFIFVGIVEFLFFMNVATKYVPTAPSLLFVSFFTSLKTSLTKNIIEN